MHDSEDAGPQDDVSDWDMHVYVIAWQDDRLDIGHLSRGCGSTALWIKGVLLISTAVERM